MQVLGPYIDTQLERFIRFIFDDNNTLTSIESKPLSTTHTWQSLPIQNDFRLYAFDQEEKSYYCFAIHQQELYRFPYQSLIKGYGNGLIYQSNAWQLPTSLKRPHQFNVDDSIFKRLTDDIIKNASLATTPNNTANPTTTITAPSSSSATPNEDKESRSSSLSSSTNQWRTQPINFHPSLYENATPLSILQTEVFIQAIQEDWMALKSKCQSKEEYCQVLEAVRTGSLAYGDENMRDTIVHAGKFLREWFRSTVMEKLDANIFFSEESHHTRNINANDIHRQLSRLMQIEIALLLGRELPKPTTTLEELINQIKSCSEEETPTFIGTISDDLISKMDSIASTKTLFTSVDNQQRATLFYALLEKLGELAQENTGTHQDIVALFTELDMLGELVTFTEIFPAPMRAPSPLRQNSFLNERPASSIPTTPSLDITDDDYDFTPEIS